MHAVAAYHQNGRAKNTFLQLAVTAHACECQGCRMAMHISGKDRDLFLFYSINHCVYAEKKISKFLQRRSIYICGRLLLCCRDHASVADEARPP